MIVRDACPAWGSTRFQKNGQTHHGTQPHLCTTCPRQFVQGSEHDRISDETRALIVRVLVERISRRGMGRAMGVGLTWLVGFRIQGIEALPDHLHVESVPYNPNGRRQCLEVETDDMSRVVQQKANQQWRWLAMDATTRHVMAFYIGDRRRRRAKRLWAKIPHMYRQHATCDPEQYGVYEGVIPAVQPKTIRKLAWKTHHRERFNHTLRAAGIAARARDVILLQDAGPSRWCHHVLH